MIAKKTREKEKPLDIKLASGNLLYRHYKASQVISKDYSIACVICCLGLILSLSFIYMDPFLLVETISFAIVAAYCFAKLEIQVEGDHGWASGLPTWRKVTIFSTILYGSKRVPITGYHVWLFRLIFVLYHFLFLFIPWTIKLEVLILAQILLTFLIEDFLWFVLNPKFGLKNFNKQSIPWHANWLGPIPIGYWFYAIIYALLIIAYFRM